MLTLFLSFSLVNPRLPSFSRRTDRSLRRYQKDLQSLVSPFPPLSPFPRLSGLAKLTITISVISRVYFSTPPNAKATEDYLVDHSIFFYLMDPRGKFVDAFGRSMGPREVEAKVKGYLEEWKEGGEKGSWSEAD